MLQPIKYFGHSFFQGFILKKSGWDVYKLIIKEIFTLIIFNENVQRILI